jgi:NDP-sugar pyrophosphorylase family protein
VAVEESGSLTEIAFSGRHIINPEIFKYMSDGIYTMTALYLHLAEAHNIYTWLKDDGYWFNVGTPDDLAAAKDYFLLHPSL